MAVCKVRFFFKVSEIPIEVRQWPPASLALPLFFKSVQEPLASLTTKKPTAFRSNTHTINCLLTGVLPRQFSNGRFLPEQLSFSILSFLPPFHAKQSNAPEFHICFWIHNLPADNSDSGSEHFFLFAYSTMLLLTIGIWKFAIILQSPENADPAQLPFDYMGYFFAFVFFRKTPTVILCYEAPLKWAENCRIQSRLLLFARATHNVARDRKARSFYLQPLKK